MKAKLESIRAAIIDRLHDAEYGSLEWRRWIVELRNANFLLGKGANLTDLSDYRE